MADEITKTTEEQTPVEQLQQLQENNANLVHLNEIIDDMPGGKFIWERHDDGVFAGYVTSNNENKYPDDGYQEESYYKRVQIGIQPSILNCTKFAIDTFSYTTRTSTSVSIPHSLGVVPRVVIIFSDEVTTLDCVESAFFITGKTGTVGNLTGTFFIPNVNASGLKPYTSINIAPASKVNATHFGTADGTNYYQANANYKLITMA